MTFQCDMKVVEHEDGTRITTFLKEVEKPEQENDMEKTGKLHLITE